MASSISGSACTYWWSITVEEPDRRFSIRPRVAAARAASASISPAAGQMQSLSQSRRDLSSARPLNSVWNRWVCPFTMPGITTEPEVSITVSALRRAKCGGSPAPTSAITDPFTSTHPGSWTVSWSSTVTTAPPVRSVEPGWSDSPASDIRESRWRKRRLPEPCRPLADRGSDMSLRRPRTR